jgi:hypothetical protein
MKLFSAHFFSVLTESILSAVWYRDELRRLLGSALRDPTLLDRYDWTADHKRPVVNDLIERLAWDLPAQRDDLLRLARHVVALTRYPGLERHEDAARRIAEARSWQAELKRLLADAAGPDAGPEPAPGSGDERARADYARWQAEAAQKAQARRAEEHARATQPEAYFGQILRLNGPANPTAVKQSYRELVKAYHPDRFHALDPEFAALATARTQQLNEAYAYFASKHGL